MWLRYGEAMLTQERLKELLRYNRATGIFVRLHVYSSSSGIAAGCKLENGYVQIVLEGERYLGHRLAFLYVEGYMPKFVDHRNGIRDDNAWCNLRAASPQINQQNKRWPIGKNPSGYLGVSPTPCGNFIARIELDGKKFNLGTRTTAAAAYELYVKAKRKLHKGCTI